MKKILIGIMFLTIFSCQNLPKADVPLSESQKQNDHLLFPLEVYKQKISITTYAQSTEEKKAQKVDQKQDPKAEEKIFSFDGALKKNADTFSLYAFGPMGSTLFVLKDDLKGNIDIDVKVNELKDKKEFILKLYPAIKKAFLLEKNSVEAQRGFFKQTLENPIGEIDIALEKNKVSFLKQGYFKFTVINL